MYGSSGSNFYSSNSQQPQVFQKLKKNIDRLKGEREQLVGALNVDRTDLNNVEMAMNQLNREISDKMNFVREKQKRLMELERAINETQKSYDIIVQTTNKLSNALQSESNHLRTVTRK